MNPLSLKILMGHFRHGTLFLVIAFCFIGKPARASDALDQASRLELQGQFRQAAEILTNAMQAAALSTSERKTLEFEMDRLNRIKQDFPFTQDQLFAELKKSVKDLTSQEFEKWIAEGRFDTRTIDGKRYFMTSSISNLFFRYPELEPRRIPAKDKRKFEVSVLETCESIKRAAQAEKKPYVLPKRFDVTLTVTAKPGAAPDGESIRAWLPIPRRYPFQSGFELLSSSSKIKHIDDDQSPIRSLYLDQVAQKDKPTVFSVEYNYTTHGVWFDIKPDAVRPIDPTDAALKEFTQEAPHVVFTPEIRALSRQIVGDETNPYLKAKKCYDWIAGNIKYSYAIEYSTIRNISDYCRSHGYGDCGQEALLFITLCRLNGIPARWQSGWNTVPGGKTIHDWSEIYLAPYGWMPVDPYMGIYATRYITTLTPEQKKEVRDFYFGGLDQYRMAANSYHNQPLTPPKNSMRSDDVDFQRGELEWGNHNIYFDQYSWDLQWKEIKPAQVE
jgi:transglutaminase-like putative cysteine protease